MEYEITGLYSYPIKSFAGNFHNEISIDDFGFTYDRRFMLVDESGKFVTLRTYPQISLVSSYYSEQTITIKHVSFDEIRIPLCDFNETREVIVWQDKVVAKSAPATSVNSLSEYLGAAVYLVYLPESSFRQVDREFFDQDKRVSFADAFPFLLANEASLDDLNSRLDKDIEMKRFRPNIVFKGSEAFQEDNWKRIKIGDIEFSVVKPCSRCVATTIDSDGRKTGKEPLRTLATYRTNEYGVCFGQNLVQHSIGSIRVGDKLSVIE